MLPRVNRIVKSADFRTVMRSGRRLPAAGAVVYLRHGGESSVPPRFGFIVSKAVGSAVTRNLVTRRLRAISRDLIPLTGPGVDVVIRALPGIAEVPWASLHSSVIGAVDRAKA